RIQPFLHALVCGAVALAMVSTLTAQNVIQGTAKVIRMKGNARFTTGNGVFQPLKVGDVLKPGTLIQTEKAKGSFVDLALSDGKGVAAIPVAAGAVSTVAAYQPSSEQNVVRLWEDTALSVDKL